jgi:tetratricopeptide (TPR) repeat protein
MVGVPRALVSSINGIAPVATIETRAGGVNAACGLSGSGRSVRVDLAMASKEECFDRAVDHVADGDLDAAIAAYREALEIDPDFTDAIQGLAMAYADKEMFDEAIVWGKRLVELVPDETLAHTSLSMFYQRKGMIPEAEAEGAKARMLDWKRQLAEQKKEQDS